MLSKMRGEYEIFLFVLFVFSPLVSSVDLSGGELWRTEDIEITEQS